MHNFAIVGTPRTGSSALAQIIGFHPHIACGWEWAGRLPWHRKLVAVKRALAGDYSMLTAKNQAHMRRIVTNSTTHVGFRAMFRSSDRWLLHPRHNPALWLDRLEAHLRWFATRPDIAIIHIRRDDNLAWLSSYLLARTTQLYIGKPYSNDLRFNVAPASAARRIGSKYWLDQRLASLQDSNPYLAIRYETLSNHKKAAGDAAVRFLGCDSNEYSIDTSKMIAKQSLLPVSERLENYAELKRVLHEKHGF